MTIPNTLTRPDWTFVERAYRVWSEDDATVHTRDHETIDVAFRRIYKVSMPTPLETYDDGEIIYRLMPAFLVVCDSYPGNSSLVAWPMVFENDPVTIVLKFPVNAAGGSRLVHTAVRSWGSISRLPTGVKGQVFDANDDDRPQHYITDHTLTWLQGHVDLKSEVALQLIRTAEQADKEAG